MSSGLFFRQTTGESLNYGHEMLDKAAVIVNVNDDVENDCGDAYLPSLVRDVVVAIGAQVRCRDSCEFPGRSISQRRPELGRIPQILPFP